MAVRGVALSCCCAGGVSPEQRATTTISARRLALRWASRPFVLPGRRRLRRSSAAPGAARNRRLRVAADRIFRSSADHFQARRIGHARCARAERANRFVRRQRSLFDFYPVPSDGRGRGPVGCADRGWGKRDGSLELPRSTYGHHQTTAARCVERPPGGQRRVGRGGAGANGDRHRRG